MRDTTWYIRRIAPFIYVAAIMIGAFTGTAGPIAAVGAILLGGMYAVTGGGTGPNDRDRSDRAARRAARRGTA